VADPRLDPARKTLVDEEKRAAGRWWERPLGTRRRQGVVGILLVLGVIYPFAMGAMAARVAATRLEARLGVPVRIRSGLAGIGAIALMGIEIGPPGQVPVVKIAHIRIPFSAALLRRGTVDVAGLVVDAHRGGADDNVTAILRAQRARKSTAADGSGAPATRLPALRVHDARVSFRDSGSGLSVEIPSLTGDFRPGDGLDVTFNKIDGRLAVSTRGKGPRFGAESVNVAGPLDGIRPRGYPTVTVVGGFASPLPTLALTGIHGKIYPGPSPGTAATAAGDKSAPSRPIPLVVDLQGSYGGARETLWTARGGIDPGAHEGQLSLVAERFSLGEIADVLPKTVLSPKDTHVNAAFDVSWAEGAMRFGGDLQVGRLSVEHGGLASDPIRDLDLSLSLRGTAFPGLRRVSIERLEARIHELRGRLTGFVELAPGAFVFTDGNKLGFLPRMELTLEVPKLPCAKLLSSLPASLIPRLQGFELQGSFGAEIEARIDYANLDELELKGKVGIDGCRVLKAPDDVKALVAGDSVTQRVEVPRPYGSHGPEETEELEFVVGPENPEFVPYEEISPALIASIMTTEDNGFFKHRGWVTSEFKTALKGNLRRGGFRGGASSITMQMVKNVLLSQEKTLSRKLQELFLVWYLEQEVPKERILELYFNAIEFGPRVYGIGRAARHYFGKSAAELTPLEGAFFSSILPSPKRRYIQYCHGAPVPTWDRYVRRILAKVHERGRLTDEEYAAAQEQKLTFDRTEAGFTERQCLDWVKKITARPEPEIMPDVDVPAGNDAEGTADYGPLPRRLRRLLANELRRSGSARSPRVSP